MLQILWKQSKTTIEYVLDEMVELALLGWQSEVFGKNYCRNSDIQLPYLVCIKYIVKL